jgi:hypothetical protein
MEGERDEPEKRGIVPNSFAHIFGHIAKCKGEVQYVSYIIYINCIKTFVIHEYIVWFTVTVKPLYSDHHWGINFGHYFLCMVMQLGSIMQL